MATATSLSSASHGRPTYSCIRCADRKVKCDRQTPCSACVKHKVDCVFNHSQPPRKRQKRINDQILTDRLKHYEALLQEQGIDPSKLPDTPDSEPRRSSGHTAAVATKESQLQSPFSIEIESNRSTRRTQSGHGHGRFKFVETNLWTRVVDESHDPEDTLEDSSNDASDLEAFEDDFGFVLNSQSKSNTRCRHPPPERILQIWQIFVENVDPLTKVVHVPTLRSAIQKAASIIGAIPRSFEALMFAIYGAAVMTLKDDECEERLGEPRKALLSRYISATKAALSRAKFMGTTSLVVLQALVLHVLSVRDIYEPRAVWSLTGVAVRIAQGMGLERDGVYLGLPPFETEMRRRIWWLLKTHDFRTAELCGLAKFRDLDMGDESTKWPTNVNDDQLFPGMPSLVAESNKLTDLVFVALRYELANFAAGRVARFRQQGKTSSQWDLHASGSEKVDMDEIIKELEEMLETKYLRYCDPSQPLHLMAMLVARFALNIIRFLTHHPRRWASIEQTPLSERQWGWEISVKLLEQHNMVLSNPQLKQFAWHAPYFQQWHAFIHVLDTLRADPLIADAEKAWQLISNIYENTPDMVFDTKKPIHVAIGNLCLKGYGDREAALQHGSACPPTPGFILQLRQQREVAKAKKQARDAKINGPVNPVSLGQANASVINLSDTLESTYLQQSTTAHQLDLTQTGGASGGDPLWFVNGFDDGGASGLDDVMDMDLDFLVAQGPNLDDNATPPITWEQWDAWIADSNVMRP
ncbi:mitogen-activated protein kinase [Mytilinidion resinicola]|uniref:Mitogen-activated protein kinase n=1 Tax=Mytilinidion resinicola TaxID=574789 RepID=A0A6A6YEY7_9PEZI|nr:mitogen-activated protein kinase [Mytilinidion resinicola]KAF2807396.1 mitogen-activated protein kinase [Mytilinidion resinicola]